MGLLGDWPHDRSGLALIFTPFWDYRVAVDTLFIIDPYLDGMLIMGLMLGWLYRRFMYRWAGIVTAGYVIFCALVTGIGHVQVYNWAARMVLDHGLGVFERTIFALEIELDHMQQIEKVIYIGQNGDRHIL